MCPQLTSHVSLIQLVLYGVTVACHLQYLHLTPSRFSNYASQFHPWFTEKMVHMGAPMCTLWSTPLNNLTNAGSVALWFLINVVFWTTLSEDYLL